MQKKYRFQIIDAFILLLILALLAGFVYLFIVRPYVQKPVKTTSVLYTLEFQALDPDVAKKAMLNDVVYHAKTDTVLGTIEEISIRPTQYQLADKNNTVITLNHPKYVTVTLTVRAEIQEKNPIMVDGTVLRIGSPYQIKTVHFTGNGICRSLTVQ